MLFWAGVGRRPHLPHAGSATGLQRGFCDLSNAAIAETWGHAMDVPDLKRKGVKPGPAAKILTPGAATSGCSSKAIAQTCLCPVKVQKEK
ncbi:hypothetical protein EJ110_NYTH49711 [Nymphaea thermarum]|nr:hypothetical protein EJ110_NYTH49711 [Nymphaea thermarum]